MVEGREIPVFATILRPQVMRVLVELQPGAKVVLDKIAMEDSSAVQRTRITLLHNGRGEFERPHVVSEELDMDGNIVAWKNS